MTNLPFTRIGDGIRLTVRLTPRAGRDAVAGLTADAEGRPALTIRLTAPPVEGQANAALVAFLARVFSIPKGRVRIHSGETGRLKRVDILGDTERMAQALEALIADRI